MVKPSLPTTASLNQIDGMATEDAIRSLNNTMKQLTKELEYSLYNLDEENFNEVEWGNITSPIYAQIEDANENIATLQLTADKFDVMVSGIGSDGLVTTASIVAAINATTGTSIVKIAADHIDITGTVKFLTPTDVGASGSTTISGSRITTGTLNASLITAGTLSADRINGGMITSSSFRTEDSGNDNGTLIDGGYLKMYEIGESSSKYCKFYWDATNTWMEINSTHQIYVNSGDTITMEATDGFGIAVGGTIYCEAAGDFVVDVDDVSIYATGDVSLNGTAVQVNDTFRCYADASFGNSGLDVDVYFYGIVNFSNATVVGLP